MRDDDQKKILALESIIRSIQAVHIPCYDPFRNQVALLEAEMHAGDGEFMSFFYEMLDEIKGDLENAREVRDCMVECIEQCIGSIRESYLLRDD